MDAHILERRNPSFPSQGDSTISGYANRVITRHFPDLAEDGDDVWVCIRNPKLMAPGEMSLDGIELNGDGTPKVGEDGMRASYKMAAKLIIGWRVYDPAAPIELDEHGEMLPAGDMPLLPSPPTPENVAKLPIEIFSWLGEELGNVNPQLAPAWTTGNPS